MKWHWYFLHPTTKWPWLFVSWPWLRYLPQPKWAQKFYYSISYLLWHHPSRYHWKRGILCCSCVLSPGRRCLWCGCYEADYYSWGERRIQNQGGSPPVDPSKKAEYREWVKQREIESDTILEWRQEPLKWWRKLTRRKK